MEAGVFSCLLSFGGLIVIANQVRSVLAVCRWLIVNSSAGKDSQAMMDFIAKEVVGAGLFPAERVVVVHANLGRAEWQGTLELAEQQARFYGFRFEVVKRRTASGKEQELPDQVRARKKQLVLDGKPNAPAWPSSTTRYCTSDQKRGPVKTLWTRLCNEAGRRHHHVIINAMGLRALEFLTVPSVCRSPCTKAATASERFTNGCQSTHGVRPRCGNGFVLRVVHTTSLTTSVCPG